MIKLYQYINRWYMITGLFVFVFTLQYLLISKLSSFLSHSDGMKNPDQMFWYDHSYLLDLYAMLGDEGITLYQHMLYLDFIYAISAGLAYSALIYALKTHKKLGFSVFIPWIMTLFDYMENFAQLFLLRQPDSVNFFEAFIAASCSAGKMVAAAAGLLTIVYLLILRLKKILNIT